MADLTQFVTSSRELTILVSFRDVRFETHNRVNVNDLNSRAGEIIDMLR